jgi:hypothetical protein
VTYLAEEAIGQIVPFERSAPRNFWAAVTIGKLDPSRRTVSIKPLNDDASRRDAEDVRPTKALTAGNIERFVWVASSIAPAVIAIIVTVRIVDPDAAGADPQLHVLRPRDSRSDRQPTHCSEPDQYELEGFVHFDLLRLIV